MKELLQWYSLHIYIHLCTRLHNQVIQRAMLHSPMGGQEHSATCKCLKHAARTTAFYPSMLRAASQLFLCGLHYCTCPLFASSSPVRVPGRPIRFMASRNWMRARVVVLFPHQYGIAGHSSQCFSTSRSSSYETITW